MPSTRPTGPLTWSPLRSSQARYSTAQQQDRASVDTVNHRADHKAAEICPQDGASGGATKS